VLRFAAELRAITMAGAQFGLHANRFHGYNKRIEALCLLRFRAVRNKFSTLSGAGRAISGMYR
jgi:hypothetical protein